MASPFDRMLKSTAPAIGTDTEREPNPFEAMMQGSAARPRPTRPPGTPPPKSTAITPEQKGQRFEKWVRGSPGIAGSIFGFSMTPGPPAAKALGSALMFTAGVYSEELVLDIARISGMKGLSPPMAMEDLAGKTISNMALDIAGSSTGPALSLFFRGGAKAFAKGFAVPTSIMDVIKRARMLKGGHKELGGIHLSLAQGSTGAFLPFISKTIGQYPLVAPSFRKGAERVGGEILRAKEHLFMLLGPVKGMADVGWSVHKTANKRFGYFAKKINDKYLSALKSAERATAHILVPDIKTALKEMQLSMIAEHGKEAIIGSVGKRAHPAWTFLTSMDTVAENAISFKRYKGFLDQLDSAARRMDKEKTAGMLQLHHYLDPVKEAAEKALKDYIPVNIKNVSDHPILGINLKFDSNKALIENYMQGSVTKQELLASKQVVSEFQAADTYYGRIQASLFETPLARDLATIQRNRFSVGVTRLTKYPSETLAVISSNFDKPEFWKDFSKLMNNPDKYDEVVAAFLHSEWEKNLTAGQKLLKEEGIGSGFDIAAFASKLGLNDVKSLAYAGTKSMLSRTNTTVGEFKTLIDAAEVAMRNAPPKTNMFIARAIQFGSLSTMKNLLLPGIARGVGRAGALGAAGAGGGLGLAGATSLLLIARGIGNMSSDPRILRAATEALDLTKNIEVRRAAAITMLVLYEKKWGLPENRRRVQEKKEQETPGLSSTILDGVANMFRRIEEAGTKAGSIINEGVERAAEGIERLSR